MSRSLHTMGHQCNTSELYSLTQTLKKRDLVLVSEKSTMYSAGRGLRNWPASDLSVALRTKPPLVQE